MKTNNEIAIAKLRVTLCDVLEHFACSNTAYPNDYEQALEMHYRININAEKRIIEKIEKVLRETE